VRTLLVGALAMTLVGCSFPLRQQAGFDSCAGTNGCSCSAAPQPIEPKPVSFKTNSAPLEIKTASAAKTEAGTVRRWRQASSAQARDRADLDVKMSKSTMVAAKVEPPASPIPLSPRSLDTRLQAPSNATADSNATRANIPDSHPAGGADANSNTRTIREQVAAATAVAELMTVATLAPGPESKANNKDGSDSSETVYLLMARPEIKSVSDLTNKIIAIDDGHSAFNGNVRFAIEAAGAPEVQLSHSQTKAIDRVISGEVLAAVLTVVSLEAAEGFPDIAGFKLFRIPLPRRSLKARP
jgi:hypothetical protein